MRCCALKPARFLVWTAGQTDFMQTKKLPAPGEPPILAKIPDQAPTRIIEQSYAQNDVPERA
jgi:hypothetical protein